ncbi:hypothetical protein HanIR_Chr15g0747841 [Helianthus annuus]|nr:hypothetical protein HanIR_Chr15g0747841 [Helianthus annuus]
MKSTILDPIKPHATHHHNPKLIKTNHPITIHINSGDHFPAISDRTLLLQPP